MDDILTKRIFLKEEAEEIKKLQQNAPEFNKHYPKHSEWLTMAISEIAHGRRFAFGAYKTIFDDNNNPVVSLVGSIILKKETYSHIMQLKNLYIKTTERKKGIGKKLFSAIEEFCIKRGAVGIDTEVPYEERGTINFLNTQGFDMQNLFESPYKKGDKIYRMYKRLPSKFTGDPFDLFHLSCWLFETIYDFRVVDRIEPNLTFVSEPKFNFETTKNSETESIHIRGSAVVLDETAVSSKVFEFHNKNKDHLLAVVAPNFEDTAKKFCEEHRILTLDKATLEKELENALAIEFPPFRRDEISGMIVRMNSKYLNDLNGGGKNQTYFKGGPIGKYLKEGDLILFFVEQSSNFADGGIWAYSEVGSCEVGEPKEIWNKYQDKNPIFPKEEYFAWCFDKTEIVALNFSEVIKIDSITYHKIKDEITKTPLDKERLGHFYLNAVEINKFLKIAKKSIEKDRQTDDLENKGELNLMDPISIISAISAGLNLMDKFRDLALKVMKKENKAVSVEAKQEGDKLQINRNGVPTEEITAKDLHLNYWDNARYMALEKKIKINWEKFNRLDGKLPLLSTDEQTRIELQMEEIRSDLCGDFREIINIYERTLGISLSDHYSLYEICNER